ncbi:hypothetical protein D3C78_1830500 [compost metagenome]
MAVVRRVSQGGLQRLLLTQQTAVQLLLHALEQPFALHLAQQSGPLREALL